MRGRVGLECRSHLEASSLLLCAGVLTGLHADKSLVARDLPGTTVWVPDRGRGQGDTLGRGVRDSACAG